MSDFFKILPVFFCLFFSQFAGAETLNCSYEINYRNSLSPESGTFSQEVSECIEGLPCALEPFEIATANSCLLFFSKTFRGRNELTVSFSECNNNIIHKTKILKSAVLVSVGAEVGPRLIWIDCSL